ncbi:MAG: cyanophycin synthetase, partial [Deltaproteobacteria bacterium]
TAHWPGRMELIHGSPPILLDCAHNPAGAAALAESLSDFSYNRLLLVAGIMSDKDAMGIFSILANKVHRGYAVTPSVERALDGRKLAVKLNDLGIQATSCGSVAMGIESARRDAGENDLVLVCGSIFTVGEAKAMLAGSSFEGIRG